MRANSVAYAPATETNNQTEINCKACKATQVKSLKTDQLIRPKLTASCQADSRRQTYKKIYYSSCTNKLLEFSPKQSSVALMAQSINLRRDTYPQLTLTLPNFVMSIMQLSSS